MSRSKVSLDKTTSDRKTPVWFFLRISILFDAGRGIVYICMVLGVEKNSQSCIL